MNRKEKIRKMLPVLRDRQVMLDETITEFKGDRKTSCDDCTSPGCCYQKSVVQFAEAVTIADYLKKNGRSNTDLRKQLHETGLRMEADTRAGWFSKAVPCVFLDNKRCSIYEVRPVSCRTYYVVGSPENCQPPESKGIAQIDMRSMIMGEVEQLTAVHLFWSIKETPEKLYMRSLPIAVLLAFAFLEEPTIEVLNKIPWPKAMSLGNETLSPVHINPHKDK